MNEEVRRHFDQAFAEIDKGFKAIDWDALKDSRLEHDVQRLPNRITIPLTFRNRIRMFCLAFSRAKAVRL